MRRDLFATCHAGGTPSCHMPTTAASAPIRSCAPQGAPCDAMKRALVLITLLVSGLASATDTWTTPFAGVKHLHRTTSTPWNIHALVVDLTVPGVKLQSTASSQR